MIQPGSLIKPLFGLPPKNIHIEFSTSNLIYDGIRVEMGQKIWTRACECLGIGFRMRCMPELQDFQKHAKTGKFLFHGENGFLENRCSIIGK